MGKLYELLTGVELGGATITAPKTVPQSREPRIIWLSG
jgi:hypothetical protein